ncbi:hypothetical protein Cgig2_020075 [Carnegiea gigantea]|uniref:Kinesin motor domain-containing protein n=1 Tax=Carnegiea gigantea TaxID=171969 RepID=A0A9Q1QIX8_9CARY|nr:hypothetical protein Cgig2_020075 [Carnegiea gigantea]
MLRDFKLLRLNTGKNQDVEEIENVPINPSDSASYPTGSDSSRAPLHAIPEPPPKTSVEHEVNTKSKFDKTPTKPSRGKSSETASLHLRTPERQGNGTSGRSRFGFLSINEYREDRRSEMPNPVGLSSRHGLNLTPRENGAVARANSAHSECTSTQSTPTKSVSKPPNPGFAPWSSSRHNGSARAGTYGALSRRFSVSGGQPSVVNTAEVPHFDLKEDPSFWMDHNVQVIIRVRPLNAFERNTHGYSRCVRQDSAQSITWIGQPETRFTFDHVACETVNQEMLFRMAGLPMVENCLSGYNSCMFAYGQEEESRKDEKLKYSCKCSFLEIHNEQITDLLDPSSTNLLLREDVKKGVYVENLSEFEVHTVGDILGLLIQGSSNRKVAATKMNRESSRSHSVFTCIIESKWERNSTANLRFARLNLVDLAGSERQKSSGAEGERLKEAANINKSLSTLGHVIMLLVDIAHGKPRHDSLGGNSKTMIIANISPSIGCAAETLNTLKFAQRAKLIQNNAVVNEDSPGDVAALQHQIWLLKEELAALKRQNVSRTLAFDPATAGRGQKNINADVSVDDQLKADDLNGSETKGSVRVSSKQLKSLETMLAGALRREQMAETSIKQLEAEIEQLNRLVNQREEDTRCTKMMLKFREDKIRRMESLLGDLKPVDTYLLEENAALSEEVQLLRAKIDKNPEVTRFAYENIRLLEQLRKYQDFYEEGEREILMREICELRLQLMRSLDNSSQLHDHAKFVQDGTDNVEDKESLRSELTNALDELAKCHSRLKSCLESNAKLSREIEDLQAMLRNKELEIYGHKDIFNTMKEVEIPCPGAQAFYSVKEEKHRSMHGNVVMHAEDILTLELELDILKILLREERLSRGELEEMGSSLIKDVQLADERTLFLSKQCEDATQDLNESKSVIEALESQQLLMIEEIEDLKNQNNRYLDLLHEQELKISALKEQACGQDSVVSCLRNSEAEESPLQAQLIRMQASLDKAKRVNTWYQSNHASQRYNEEEMDETRRQAEAETAEAIVCLQEELSMLQHQVQESEVREREAENKLLVLEARLKELQENSDIMSLDNEAVRQILLEKDIEIKSLTEDWELLSCEIEQALVEGHDALRSASDQLDSISSPVSDRRGWISEQLSKIVRQISDKESTIEELNLCLKDANGRINDMEHMLMALRGAAMVMTESHQQECYEKEKEVMQLKSELNRKTFAIAHLEHRMRVGHDEMRKLSACATAAFVIVNRLSELNSIHVDTLRFMETQLTDLQEANRKKDVFISDQAIAFEEAHRRIADLGKELEVLEGNSTMLKQQLDEQRRNTSILQKKLEENEEYVILKTQERLNDLKIGVTQVRTSINMYTEKVGDDKRDNQRIFPVDVINGEREPLQMSNKIKKQQTKPLSSSVVELEEDFSVEGEKVNPLSAYNSLESMKSCNTKEVTLTLLRKEIESAMQSLKEVQAEMAHLCAEKEEICNSEKKGREGMEIVKAQVLSLQSALSDFKTQCEGKILALNHKLQNVKTSAEDARSSWWQTKESLEFELQDAKAMTSQKTAEASRFLVRFGEVQDTMKEADIMINGLMIANETMKLEIEELRKRNEVLTDKRDSLISEVQGLQSSNELKDQQCKNLEDQFELHFSEIMSLIQGLEIIVSLAQGATEDALMSLVSDFNCIKSLVQDAVKFMHSSLEELWSQIFMKDCALSVLHLCHMGVLMEAVTGLNTENGLLHHGICESNAVISDLRKRNIISKEELEMCRMLKVKLLADIKNGFDRISNKEGEARELRIKLSNFQEMLLALQRQEELMLERSNIMGSELALLMNELDQCNSNVMASLSEQKELLRSKEEVIKSQDENFTATLYEKDLGLLVLASQLQQLAHHNAEMAKEQKACRSALDHLTEDMITLGISANLREQLLLENETEATYLRTEVVEAKNSEAMVLTQLQTLQAEYKILGQHLSMEEEENKSLQSELQELKCKNCTLLKDLRARDSDLESSTTCIGMLKLQIGELLENICTLESRIATLEEELEMKKVELDDFECSQLSTTEALCKKSQDLESCAIRLTRLEDENHILRDDFQYLKCKCFEELRASSSQVPKCVSFMETADVQICGMLKQLDENVATLLDRMTQDTCLNQDMISNFLKEMELLEYMAKGIVSQNISLQEELFRKDEVLNGLLFDLRLLQESAANSKDQKDELEELTAALESMEDELALRSRECDEAVAYGQMLETKVKEQGDVILALETDLERANQSAKMLSDENMELQSYVEDISAARASADRELIEKRSVIDSLENELLEMGNTLGQLNELVESVKSNLDEVSSERDHLQKEIMILEGKVETAYALADENAAIAAEAQEIAESRRVYAEEKEEEVKLLEKSVQELDSTISVLEDKVDILKGEAERQRLQREELELELHALKNKMHNVESTDADVKRHLDEKARNLQEALKRIKILEKDLANKDTEIAQCKAHILELTVHAEAQASEYKHKFKELEAMVEQVKAEEALSHDRISANKLEKNASKGRGSASPFKAKGSGSPFKPRGSGSPFKCIGLGLAHQLKSEKDEELNAERLRIEELEALAASRQKEIFMLNARLAAAESMTHDVIRDLLGVKLDMSNYVVS